MRNKIIISMLSLLLVGCSSQQSSPEEQAAGIPVTVDTPVVKDVNVYLESLGTLQPSILMAISPKSSGNITEVLVHEGQWVKEGTPLFKINPQPYEIKVREAQAQLAMDEADFNAIQKKMERYRHLVQKDLITQTEWDDLQASIEKSLASIHLDKARLNAAEIDLGNCIIRSPIEGRVGKLDLHAGTLVSAGQATPLVCLAKMDPLLVEFKITEKEFSKLPKTLLHIEITGLNSSTPYEVGTVTFLDNHFDSTTGLLLVRGTIPNPDHSLRPGQSVKIKLPVATTSKAELIQQRAIRYNQYGPYVYVVQQDMTVALRQLILGDEVGTDRIVLEGLDPTEQIIIDGHLRLSPGTKVEIKP